jgi:hypothetical protein
MINEPPFRRVVVALDAVSELRAPVDAAAALARSWGAELHGLFVRDAGLLGLTELPFVREVTLTAAPRLIAPEELLAAVAASAAAAERVLGEAAAREGLAWSFRAITGPISPDALSAIGPGEFVVVHGLARRFTPYFQPASPWAGIVGRLDMPRLVLRGGAALGGGVLALFSDPAKADEMQMVRVAALVARSTGLKLSLVQVASGRDATATPALTVAGERIAVDRMVAAGPALMRHLDESRCRLVAFSGSSDVGTQILASPAIAGAKDLLVV